MASNITSSTIDEQFPVAGQDNDTQGFRDNFNIIKSALVTAATEITALQNNTAGLACSGIDGGSDFNTSIISNATLKDNIESTLNGGERSDGTVEINFGNANWQIFRIAANTSFTIVGYPNDVGEEQGAKITLELTGDGTSRTITFPEDGIIGIKKSASFPTTVQSESNPILIEISTRAVSTGRIIFLNYLGQFSS
jgi:hypothetical protein